MTRYETVPRVAVRPGSRQEGPLSSLSRAVRPKQWLKNTLVGGAPLAAGSLFVPSVLGREALTFVALCLASSAGYLVNDVLDVAKDRVHPTKRRRPVASGALSPRLALVASGMLAAAALLVGTTLVSVGVGLVLVLYLALTVGYSLGLKRLSVFDLGLVSAAFVLRAVAGGVAAPVPLTEWFLIVASFGALFVVAGKRYADVLQREEGTGQSWAVVPYTVSYLRFVWSLAATATVVGYFIWSFDVGAVRGHSSVWAEVSVAPFVLAVLRYATTVDRGAAGSPEDVLLRDRGLQLLVLLWLVSFGIAADVLG
jgi:decaprenyl-phosphate phosphoribosyltransferase